MSEYQLTVWNSDDVFNAIEKRLNNGEPALILEVKSPQIGKWTMTRLWRSWMGQVAEFMAGNGVTMPLMISKDGKYYGERPFNANDAHDLFVSQFLGLDEKGRRLSFSKSRKEDDEKGRPATKGERFLCMQKMEAWATEKGVNLKQPRHGEYNDLKKESEG